MWFTAGEAVTLVVDYTIDGQFVVPDSAAFQLRDPSGTLLLSGSLTAESTTESITIPAPQNILGGGNSFETRFLQVQFLHDGHTYDQRLSYRISAFMPFTGTPAHVRAELGLDFSELPDADIDLPAAYLELTATTATLIPAFLLGSVRGLAANQAVVLQAAINVASSLELRTGITTRSEDHLFTRSNQIDFAALAARLQARLAKLIGTAIGEVVVLNTGGALFTLSTPTDAVTGA